VAAELKKLGYTYVALDLEGYRTGSLNEPFRRASKKRRS
jgi:PP-loop superfamily ATP-utilizing enzyme